MSELSHSDPETSVIGTLAHLAELAALPNLAHLRVTGTTTTWHDWDRLDWNIKTHEQHVWKEARFDDTIVTVFPPLKATLQAVSG